MEDLRLEAPHTHLYPGLTGGVSGALPAGTGEKPAVCQVAFADGSMALGTLAVPAGAPALLETWPYTTAAGTRIPAKRWRIEIIEGGGGERRFKVRAKLAAR